MQRVVRSIISPAGGLRDRVALFTGREYAKGIAEKKKRCHVSDSTRWMSLVRKIADQFEWRGRAKTC